MKWKIIFQSVLIENRWMDDGANEKNYWSFAKTQMKLKTNQMQQGKLINGKLYLTWENYKKT